MNVRRIAPLLNHRAKRDTTILNYQFSIFHSYREERQQMFLNIVTADGAAEERVIREMKARAAGARGDIEQIVRGVMADVQQRGWDAVVEYAERFDGKAPYIVEPKVLDDAYNACDPKLIAALEKAAANIRDYHEQMLVKTWEWNRSKGETLGQTVRGLSRVGIYVPGGTAAYPSSVLMNAIPAKVAGVGELIMVTPPTENMSNEVLAAAKIAGVDTVIAIGGTQAIAALTYGADFIPQVDKIVGPGNIFVATAKRLLYGVVDIDMIAGPSEILIVADENADPRFVAADLMSQCEHDVLAGGVLLTDSAALAEAVKGEIARQLETLSRAEIIRQSMADYGVIVVFPDIDACIDYANAVAPEHLELAVAQPEQYLGRVENAGSVFLGDWTPEPVGDYYAGANHVLPTSGTARFFSPLGVDSFYKRMGFTAYSKQALLNGADDIIRFAEAEGLTAHANAVKVRKEQ